MLLCTRYMLLLRTQKQSILQDMATQQGRHEGHTGSAVMAAYSLSTNVVGVHIGVARTWDDVYHF